MESIGRLYWHRILVSALPIGLWNPDFSYWCRTDIPDSFHIHALANAMAVDAVEAM
jgi:hypothetical protein